MTETERFEEFIRNLGKAEEMGKGFVIDKKTKKFRQASPFDDPDEVINVAKEDFTFAVNKGSGPETVIIISGEILQDKMGNPGPNNVSFLCRDGGEVYTLLSEGYYTEAVPGTIYQAIEAEDLPASAFGKAEDRVRVIRRFALNYGQPPPRTAMETQGYVLHGTTWEEAPVEIVPVRNEIFSRFGGLLETGVLAEKKVLIIGLGSVGSHFALELAKSGIMDFFLIDDDRVEVANISRHAAGLSQVGRYKTKAMAELIKDRNPFAEIQTLEEKVSWENIPRVRNFVREANIVICVPDNRPTRSIVNRVCLEEGKPCVFAGAFHRAYGGQILFVHPRVSLCYQCFCMHLPEQARDEEISSRSQVERVAYADPSAPVEPGLSTDIAPISVMVAKLVIQEFLKGAETTLRSLDDDLVAPLYLWLNRREAGTQYEKLDPLEFNLDGMRILRWYGIDIKRHPACPACGDFEGELAKREGLDLPEVCQSINR